MVINLMTTQTIFKPYPVLSTEEKEFSIMISFVLCVISLLENYIVTSGYQNVVNNLDPFVQEIALALMALM